MLPEHRNGFHGQRNNTPAVRSLRRLETQTSLRLLKRSLNVHEGRGRHVGVEAGSARRRKFPTLAEPRLRALLRRLSTA